LALWMRNNGTWKGSTWNVFDANAFCSIFMKCPPIWEMCMLLGAYTWTDFKANEVEEINVEQAPKKR
jgi:hypothetical protein